MTENVKVWIAGIGGSWAALAAIGCLFTGNFGAMLACGAVATVSLAYVNHKYQETVEWFTNELKKDSNNEGS